MGIVVFQVVVACLIALAFELLGQKKLASRLGFTYGLLMWIRCLSYISVTFIVITVLYNLGGKTNPQSILSLNGLFSQNELFSALLGLSLLITPFAHFYGLVCLVFLATKLFGIETTAGLNFSIISLTLSWTTLFLFAEYTALSNSLSLSRLGSTIRSSTLVVFAVFSLAACGLAVFELERLADWMTTIFGTSATQLHAFTATVLLGACWGMVALGVYIQILLPLAVIPTICIMAFSFDLSPMILILPFSLAMLLNLTPSAAAGRIS